MVIFYLHGLLHWGAYIWHGQEAWLNQHIFKVIPKDRLVIKQYLFFLLKKITDELYTKTHGSGMVHITRKFFLDTYISLPSLHEQRKIVEIIEVLFSELDSSVESLKKAQEQLKVYRQAVLKNAFEGKLTESWRNEQKNLLNTEELLEEIKKERKKNYEKQILIMK